MIEREGISFNDVAFACIRELKAEIIAVAKHSNSGRTISRIASNLSRTVASECFHIFKAHNVGSLTRTNSHYSLKPSFLKKNSDIFVFTKCVCVSSALHKDKIVTLHEQVLHHKCSTSCAFWFLCCFTQCIFQKKKI